MGAKSFSETVRRLRWRGRHQALPSILKAMTKPRTRDALHLKNRAVGSTPSWTAITAHQMRQQNQPLLPSLAGMPILAVRSHAAVGCLSTAARVSAVLRPCVAL